jgi:hypothetical protein
LSIGVFRCTAAFNEEGTVDTNVLPGSTADDEQPAPEHKDLATAATDEPAVDEREWYPPPDSPCM